jgi:hypothetical protein
MCGMGLVVVSWMILKTQVKMSQLASSTWENMNLSYYVSNFIHETQKERGATGVYMGSHGVKFGGMWGTLYNQTLLCTSKRAIVRQFIAEEYIDYDDLQSYKGMLFWVDQASKLEKVRIDVVSFIESGETETAGVHFNPISTGAALGYYTTMNKHMVMTLSEMAFRGSSETVEARLLAYLGFMYMKEKAGNERAVGALGMSESMWASNANSMKYVSLVAIQANAYLYFAQFGSEEARDQFTVLSNSKANKILAPWQAAAITNDTSVMQLVTGSLWFGNMTEKINEWRLVEESIADELNSFFDVLEVETTEFVYAICAMLGVLFLFTTHIGIKGIRLLLKSNAYNIYQQRLRESKRVARLKRKKQKAAEEKKQTAKSS